MSNVILGWKGLEAKIKKSETCVRYALAFRGFPRPKRIKHNRTTINQWVESEIDEWMSRNSFKRDNLS